MKQLVFFMMTTANGLYERGPWEIDWHNTQGLGADLGLRLLTTRTFKNGNVMLSYAPARTA
ncbi:MAG: hypothetical protein M3O64_06975 [Chloroflexota bacterium]|nr:hypothetical protein [Chloroflexota bacterium]